MTTERWRCDGTNWIQEDANQAPTGPTTASLDASSYAPTPESRVQYSHALPERNRITETYVSDGTNWQPGGYSGPITTGWAAGADRLDDFVLIQTGNLSAG